MNAYHSKITLHTQLYCLDPYSVILYLKQFISLSYILHFQNPLSLNMYSFLFVYLHLIDLFHEHLYELYFIFFLLNLSLIMFLSQIFLYLKLNLDQVLSQLLFFYQTIPLLKKFCNHKTQLYFCKNQSFLILNTLYF